MTKPASKLAEDLELKPTDVSYFEYIAENYRNGRISDSYRLFKKINEHGKLNCVQWLQDRHFNAILGYFLKQEIQR